MVDRIHLPLGSKDDPLPVFAGFKLHQPLIAIFYQPVIISLPEAEEVFKSGSDIEVSVLIHRALMADPHKLEAAVIQWLAERDAQKNGETP